MRKNSARTQRLFVLSSLIIVYMILALAWWSVLLLRNNKETFELRSQMLAIEFAGNQTGSALALEEISAEFRRQKLMILGEGAVFTLALLTGMWFINRGYSREIQLVQQKRNFLLAITHELKSPLASIRLVLETLKKRNLNQDQARPVLNNGIKETVRLGELIDNLLLTAKLDRSYQIHPESVDLLSMAKEIVKTLSQKYPDARVSIAPIDGTVSGYFDKNGIRSLLRNLLENAMKYGKSSRPIQLHMKDDGKHVQIKIEDFGQGISEKDRPFIFHQFFRSGSEETRRSKGTGLGLYIVKKLVDLHHGKIVLSSSRPTGATFTIHLPKNVNA